MPLRLPTPSGLFIEGEEAINVQAASLNEDQKKALLKLYHALMPTHGFIQGQPATSTVSAAWNSVAITGIEYAGEAHLGSCYWHGCMRPIDGTNRNNPGLRPNEARLREGARRAARTPAQPEPPEEHDEDDDDEFADVSDVCHDPDCLNRACRAARGLD